MMHFCCLFIYIKISTNYTFKICKDDLFSEQRTEHSLKLYFYRFIFAARLRKPLIHDAELL